MTEDNSYDRGRRDMLNALLAPNLTAATKLARLSNREPDVEGRLPFDVVFWVSEVAEQLGIKPVHQCFICARPFRAGELVLPDITEGLGHRACYGEDREGFVNLKTGEPLGADEPLPTGEPYDPAAYPDYAAPDETATDGEAYHLTETVCSINGKSIGAGYVIVSEDRYALFQCALEAARATIGGPLGPSEQTVIRALVSLAGIAFQLCDNTANENPPEVQQDDWDQLSAALDVLDRLPDDQPGYTMGPAAKAEWALRRLLTDTPDDIAAPASSDGGAP